MNGYNKNSFLKMIIPHNLNQSFQPNKDEEKGLFLQVLPQSIVVDDMPLFC